MFWSKNNFWKNIGLETFANVFVVSICDQGGVSMFCGTPYISMIATYLLEFTRGAGSTEDAFPLTLPRVKACAKPLGPNLVQLTFVKIWQKSDESSKSAQMSKNRVSGPLIFIIPALWSSKKSPKWIPKANSAQMSKFCQKVDIRVFFTGRLEQISALIIFESAPESGF